MGSTNKASRNAQIREAAHLAAAKIANTLPPPEEILFTEVLMAREGLVGPPDVASKKEHSAWSLTVMAFRNFLVRRVIQLTGRRLGVVWGQGFRLLSEADSSDYTVDEAIEAALKALSKGEDFLGEIGRNASLTPRERKAHQDNVNRLRLFGYGTEKDAQEARAREARAEAQRRRDEQKAQKAAGVLIQPTTDSETTP